VFHGIDATQLEKHFKVLNEPGQARPSFDKIVFHFPHTGVARLQSFGLKLALALCTSSFVLSSAVWGLRRGILPWQHMSDGILLENVPTDGVGETIFRNARGIFLIIFVNSITPAYLFTQERVLRTWSATLRLTRKC
jgi:hypothetical protein